MAIKINKLGRCPECGTIIDLSYIKEIDNDKIVGCGLAEGDFIECDNCTLTQGDDECERTRLNAGLSFTTAGEYADA